MTVHVKGFDGRQAFARIAQRVIGIILRHQDIILRGQLGNALASFQRHGYAVGFWKVGMVYSMRGRWRRMASSSASTRSPCSSLSTGMTRS